MKDSLQRVSQPQTDEAGRNERTERMGEFEESGNG